MDGRVIRTTVPSLTEEELRRNFETYQRLLEELDRQYRITGPHDTYPVQETPEPPFVVEPIFFYRTQASA